MNPPTPPSPRRFGGLGRAGATAAMAFGLLSGGLAGGYLVSHAATSSASSATTTAASSTSAATPAATPPAGSGSTTAPPAGTFTPNEDPTHEAGESAAREAQENAGQRPTVP